MASIINYDEDQVAEGISNVNAQLEDSRDALENIKSAVQPLVDGQWIGEAANAFYQAAEDYAKLNERIHDETESFIQRLQQTQNNTLDMINKINRIIQS